jgi:hypothetical protein
MYMKKIIVPAFTGTTIMTLCSYLAAEYKNKNFSEAELLAEIESEKLLLSDQVALPAGWASHYTIGVMMTLLFEMYKNVSGTKPSFYQTLYFGILIGLLSIGSWKKLFKALLPRRPRFYRQFFIQLFIVHLIFAATVTATQKAINSY